MSSEQQQQTQSGQVTGGGLASNSIVQGLKKSEGGEGMTREELNAKKAEMEKVKAAQKEVNDAMNDA